MTGVQTCALPIYGDITDFFINLQKSKKDFEVLMEVAEPLELPPPTPPRRDEGRRGDAGDGRLERAKAVPLDELLEFNRQGFAICPFHSDSNPSLHWIKKSNRFYCFVDGEKGDGIDLIRELNDIDFQQAIDYLCQK